MKNKNLSLSVCIALFAGITLLNCSKKTDPAPAAVPSTTTTGTTTGTTTSGTTTMGTTTSSTTTSGTTTTASTKEGSGTFTIDGVIEKADIVRYTSGSGTNRITTIEFVNANYTSQIRIGKETLQDGSYEFGDFVIPLKDKAGIVITPLPFQSDNYFRNKIPGGTVTVSGKNIKIDLVNLDHIKDSSKKMKASCDITLD